MNGLEITTYLLLSLFFYIVWCFVAWCVYHYQNPVESSYMKYRKFRIREIHKDRYIIEVYSNGWHGLNVDGVMAASSTDYAIYETIAEAEKFALEFKERNKKFVDECNEIEKEKEYYKKHGKIINIGND